MYYSEQLSGVQTLLPQAKNVLVLLSPQASTDELAAGLSLMLSLQNAQKQVFITSESLVKVEHSNLFGVGQIQNRLPEISGGKPEIVLGGVAAADGTVPALEKLDWYTQGPDLHLVFVTIPGKTFEPSSISPLRQGGKFDLIITVGVDSLESLGALYTANKNLLSSSHIVNIDNKQNNSAFGATNIIDPSASLCEMVYKICQGLGLNLDGDTATNILAGIFAHTSNLQSNTTADTFDVVAGALRLGGQKPQAGLNLAQPFLSQTPQSFGIFNPQAVVPSQPASKEHEVEPQQTTAPEPSAEEVPGGEQVQTTSPEPDWLTPKIYHGKGSSIE